MKSIRHKVAALALGAGLAAFAPAASANPGARWMAHCAGNLKGSGLKAKIVRRYCACMGEVGEEAEMLTWSQSDLEHSYPPAHAYCHDKAHGRRPRPV